MHKGLWLAVDVINYLLSSIICRQCRTSCVMLLDCCAALCAMQVISQVRFLLDKLKLPHVSTLIDKACLQISTKPAAAVVAVYVCMYDGITG